MKTNDKKQSKEQEQEEPVAPHYKKKYVVQFAFSYEPSKGKQMDPTDNTMPDMSLSVAQLLDNHTRGKASNVKVHEPLYFETTIPTLRDMTDVQKFRDELQEKLVQVTEFIKQETAEKKEKAEAEARKKAEQLDIEIEAKKAEQAAKNK